MKMITIIINCLNVWKKIILKLFYPKKKKCINITIRLDAISLREKLSSLIRESNNAQQQQQQQQQQQRADIKAWSDASWSETMKKNYTSSEKEDVS